MSRYQLHQLFLHCPHKIISIVPNAGSGENKMKRMAAAVLMVGSLAMAGQASAHGGGGDGGAIAGALIGGAVIGALVGSAVAQPVYAQPVYAQPVYAQPAYQPVYAQPAPPPGYCYDQYRGGYVACGPAPQGYSQGYYPPRQGY
jgi:hypothetical protein